MNFWQDARRFLLYRVFGLLYSPLLLYSNVSADVSSGFLQVFCVELGKQNETSNHIQYLNHRGRLLLFHFCLP